MKTPAGFTTFQQTVNGAIEFKSEGVKGNRVISVNVPANREEELWLNDREKVDLPIVGKRSNGITKYRVVGGKHIKVRLINI